MSECQFHNNCGGWCDTPEQIERNLCEDCLEADGDDQTMSARLTDLRKAVEFLDKCRVNKAEASATGSLSDAREWLEDAARAVLGLALHWNTK